MPIERHGYAAPPKRRVFAFIATSAVYTAMAAGLFLSFEARVLPPKPTAPLLVTLLPFASPPETPPRLKVAPRPVEKHERQRTLPRIEPVERSITPLPTIPVSPPASIANPVDPAPPQPETAAPKSALAPPAPQVSSEAHDTWEGRVLARLEKVRRYPGAARIARQQGVVYVRFRMNRDGHILSSSLVRSSGFPALDQAALETLRRADPLPKIPADRPDEIDLSVPMEYYIR